MRFEVERGGTPFSRTGVVGGVLGDDIVAWEETEGRMRSMGLCVLCLV